MLQVHFRVYSQNFERHVGQRLRVYRHDAILAEVSAEGTEIYGLDAPTGVIGSKCRPISQARDIQLQHSGNKTLLLSLIIPQ